MNDVDQFLDFAIKISADEREKLETFTHRLLAVYDFRKMADAIADSLILLKTESSSAIDTQKNLNLIKQKILPLFQPLSPEFIEDFKLEELKTSEFVNVKLHEFEQIKHDFQIGANHAKNKVNHMMNEISAEIEQEKKALTRIHYLEQSYENLKLVHKEMISHLNELFNLIKETEAILISHSKIQLDSIAKSWKDISEQIEISVKKEKLAAQDLIHLFDEKFSAIRLTEKYAHSKRFLLFFRRKKKITKTDIERDVLTITSPEEFTLYNSALLKHASCLEPGALEYIQSEAFAAAKRIKTERLQLKSDAYFDTLTGLYNRRILDKIFSEQISLSKRNERSFSLILFDIDLFKNFNSVYTHVVGDVVLKEVAKYLLETKRPDDVVFRYGGEELIVILPQTGKKYALKVAERMRMYVQMQSAPLIKEINSHTSFPIGVIPRTEITVSAGVVDYPSDGKDLKALIAKASEAMQKAKESGRNRVLAAA